jgi:hypothetical protein
MRILAHRDKETGLQFVQHNYLRLFFYALCVFLPMENESPPTDLLSSPGKPLQCVY